MSRHIVDHPKTHHDTSRARAFLKIEREVRPSEATRRLQKESRGVRASRLREFLRIEKGHIA